MISRILGWTGHWRSGFIVLALACLVAGQPGQVFPQTKDSPATPGTQKASGPKNVKADQTPAPGATEKRELHIYEPRFAKANDLATLLVNLYRSTKQGDEPILQVTVDDTTNRLLFSASASHWHEIGELLSKIDVQTDEGAALNLKLIPLGKGLAEDFASLQKVLNMLFANSPTVKYTLDQPRKLLILQADAKIQAEVQNLCRALAEAHELAKARTGIAQVASTMQIRLLWLVDSEDKQDGAALTGDVLKIVPVLAKLGVEHPRLLSNSLVTSNGNNGGSVFKSFGNAIFRGEGPTSVDLSGNCRPIDNNRVFLTVDLRINAEENAKGEIVGGLAGVSTEIQAPLGHYVVLGMSPCYGKTSVFVVQVTQVE